MVILSENEIIQSNVLKNVRDTPALQRLGFKVYAETAYSLSR